MLSHRHIYYDIMWLCEKNYYLELIAYMISRMEALRDESNHYKWKCKKRKHSYSD